MRLPENQIKQGILHPDQLVRDMALRYFSESFSLDDTVLPLAIQAIETHGWDRAFGCPGEIEPLVQTEETLLWFIDQLNRLGRPESPKDAMACQQLSSVIGGADVALLMKHEARIMGVEGLTPEGRDVIAERLRLLTIDTDACWDELEALCEEIKGVQHADPADIQRATRLAEAIARDGESSANRILTNLSPAQKRRANDPMAWMECFAGWIAGELRLEAAVPLLVARIKADAGDQMDEECRRALIKIGTDPAVEALCKDWPSATGHFKRCASSVLAHIHSDMVVSRCLGLYGQEAKTDIQSNLARALLNNFSSEGVEPARQLVLCNGAELRGDLVAAAMLMGASFPELEDLRSEERALAEHRRRHVLELAEMAFTSTSGTSSSDHFVQPKAPPPIVRQEKVGRNDPCPCGSGKKYKKCCLGKGA